MKAQLFIYIFFLPMLGLACPSLSLACPLLKKSGSFESSFTQKRYIRGLYKPIVSSGRFEVREGEEVLWKTTEPFESTVTITKEGFKVDKKEYSQSRLKQLSTILLELHSGNFNTLEKTFSFDCKKQDDGTYLLTVAPSVGSLKKVFSSIEMKGKNRAENIRFTDARGDITQIELRK